MCKAGGGGGSLEINLICWKRKLALNLHIRLKIIKIMFVYFKNSHTVAEAPYYPRIIPIKGLFASLFHSILSIDVTCVWFLVG